MSKKGISRRTLFGSTALMAGANLLIPSAAAQVVPNSCAPLPTKWDFEADVVVIGAGACGMAGQPLFVRRISVQRYLSSIQIMMSAVMPFSQLALLHWAEERLYRRNTVFRMIRKHIFKI